MRHRCPNLSLPRVIYRFHRCANDQWCKHRFHWEYKREWRTDRQHTDSKEECDRENVDESNEIIWTEREDSPLTPERKDTHSPTLTNGRTARRNHESPPSDTLVSLTKNYSNSSKNSGSQRSKVNQVFVLFSPRQRKKRKECHFWTGNQINPKRQTFSID